MNIYEHTLRLPVIRVCTRSRSSSRYDDSRYTPVAMRAAPIRISSTVDASYILPTVAAAWPVIASLTRSLMPQRFAVERPKRFVTPGNCRLGSITALRAVCHTKSLKSLIRGGRPGSQFFRCLYSAAPARRAPASLASRYVARRMWRAHPPMHWRPPAAHRRSRLRPHL